MLILLDIRGYNNYKQFNNTNVWKQKLLEHQRLSTTCVKDL